MAGWKKAPIKLVFTFDGQDYTLQGANNIVIDAGEKRRVLVSVTDWLIMRLNFLDQRNYVKSACRSGY